MRAAIRAAAGVGLGAAGLAGWAPLARARGRSPVGGAVALRLPWSLATIDPHRLDDVAAALFGDALFDGLYAFGADGAPAPALAEGEPEPDGDGLRVRVREGLTTAHGRPLDARDVAYSLARARGAGAAAWLGDAPSPTRAGTTTVRFATRDAVRLTRALASPLAAIVPLPFAPERPDGTGPFRAERRGDALVLARNPRAARGPAFVDEITVRGAGDLASSLRAFESGADDVGWLGTGLHEPRPGARPFDAGACAWAVLRTGRDAGSWDAPGVAQRVADGILPSRLSFLVVGPAWRTDREEGWGGPPGEVVVRDDSPWLVELARAVAASLTRPGHELSARPLPPAELAQRRTQRSFALAVDVARPLAPGPLGALVGLATADDPTAAADLVRHAPRLAAATSPRSLTRTLRLGVLGDVRVQGGRVATLDLPVGPAGWDLGGATLSRPASGGKP